MLAKLIQAEDLNNDNFISTQKYSAGTEFLQSLAWSQIIKQEGANLKFFQVSNEADIVLRAMIISKNFPFLSHLNYGYCPRGPLLKKDLASDLGVGAFKLLMDKIKEESKLVFFRFEPELYLLNSLKKEKINLQKTIDLQPQKTLLINLEQEETEILKAMHQKTRYNIRLAEKKGVVIKEAMFAINDKEQLEKDFSDFWQLMKKTSKRDDFKIHGSSHYRHLLLSGGNSVKLFFAEYEGKRIATAMFSFFGDKVTYLHGASDSEFKSLMAPYLLQFSVIKEAKNKGFKLYDFYGIDEKKWPGVTRFKLGFGGFVYEYAGTYDLVFQPFWYFLYNLMRKVRRLI